MHSALCLFAEGHATERGGAWCRRREVVQCDLSLRNQQEKSPVANKLRGFQEDLFDYISSWRCQPAFSATVVIFLFSCFIAASKQP
mmetsp:Transcript_75075/g.156476  ORF Transcript_75075/g.156476 Transcript_75075/m.156476 type:complete len:86 (+) Transcript_75075:394-651(+)